LRGIVSFHPASPALFDGFFAALVAGRKVNPDPFLADAVGIRRSAARARRIQRALELLLEAAEPPPPPSEGGLLGKIKAKLERLDYRADPVGAIAKEAVEPDLHLHGRPFFISEGSAEKVADLVDDFVACEDERAADALVLEQLVRLDPALAKDLQPDEGPELSAELVLRRDLLGQLKGLYDLAKAAEEGKPWETSAGSRPAAEVLASDLPWRTIALHARVVPMWIGRDVDGLETVCRAAGVEPPDVLVPARRLFAEAIARFPGLEAGFEVEIPGPRDLGAFVSPQDVGELFDFLNVNGSRIIRAAARHGEGKDCALLLRKIRECLAWAQRKGYGYLEASGILPPDLCDPET
jgi:hypothetical protein